MSDADALLKTWFSTLESSCGLKHRPGQRHMADEIISSITNLEISVIEGGTGIGKSFAALIAALAVRKSKQDNGDDDPSPILYATGTIALQDQLIKKDIPFLESKLNLNIKYGIAKGRGRYMCPRKAGSALVDTKTMELFGDDEIGERQSKNVDTCVFASVSELDKLFRAGKWNGDIDVLETSVSGDVINAITVPHGACLKKKCSEYSRCPFYRARNNLRKCDVIVANHDLLLCDLALGGGRILPCKPEKTDYLIDEAHKFPDTAVKQLGGRLSVAGIQSWLDSFRKTMNRHFASPVPVPGTIASLLRDANKESEKASKASTELIPILDANQNMFNDSNVWLFHDGCPQSLVEPLTRIHNALDHLSSLLESICDKASDREELEKLYVDMGFFHGKTNASLDATTLTLISDQDGEPPIARWMEAKPDGYHVNAYPTFASDRLARMFWNDAGSVSCFSATLRSIGSFKRFLSESGLDNIERKVNTCTVDSGFDYNQSGLYLLRDGPDPKNREGHKNILSNAIGRAITNVKGGILVLFTSKALLGDVYDDLIASNLDVENIILKQGVMPRDRIIHEHKKRIKDGEKSCIFGLASFGEGVDLPGDLCSSVIIARIPFPVPTTPMELARVEWIKKCGGNPFWDYSLPVSSIRLTQMVGRLIRTESDKGSVVIMDNRIARLRYGNMLISNLPPIPVKMVSSSAFLSH